MISPGVLVEGRHPLAAGGLGEADAVSLGDEFVGRALETVDGGMGEQRIGHDGQPLNRLPVARDHRRCPAVPLDHKLVVTTPAPGTGAPSAVTRDGFCKSRSKVVARTYKRL